MERELEEEEKRKDRKYIEKHTYSYQLPGSNMNKPQEGMLLLCPAF